MAKKILLIDNDAALVGNVTQDLEVKGFEVLHSGDGKEGLDLARQQMPDLIVLCVELPKASGYSICSKLKKDDALRAIPVVLTSAEAKQKTFEDHKKLKVGRADEYLLKPFGSDALVEKIGALIGLPEADGADEPLDISGLAEDVSVGAEEPIRVEEVEEISVDAEEPTPTPETLPGDEDLAVLDAAFENLEEKEDEPLEATTIAHLPNGSGSPAPNEEDDALLAGLDSPAAEPPPPAAPAPRVRTRPPPAVVPVAAAADDGELARLREQVQSLERQLEQAQSEAKPTSGSRDKEYFAVKERLAQRDKELLKVREELNAKDKELVEERDKQNALEQELAEREAEVGKRDGQLKVLQQKVDALVAGQKRTERDLATAREESKQSAAKAQSAEEELAAARGKADSHESEARRLESDLEASRARLTELEGELAAERSRADELSAELNGTRAQLEESQGALEEVRSRVASLEETAGKNEERAVKAYQKIKADEKLREKVKKALGIALQLLDEPEIEVDDGAEEQRP